MWGLRRRRFLLNEAPVYTCTCFGSRSPNPQSWQPPKEALLAAGSNRTQCINQMVLESQLPHKIVNSLFHSIIVNNELTILWGGVTF